MEEKPRLPLPWLHFLAAAPAAGLYPPASAAAASAAATVMTRKKKWRYSWDGRQRKRKDECLFGSDVGGEMTCWWDR